MLNYWFPDYHLLKITVDTCNQVKKNTPNMADPISIKDSDSSLNGQVQQLRLF